MRWACSPCWSLDTITSRHGQAALVLVTISAVEPEGALAGFEPSTPGSTLPDAGGALAGLAVEMPASEPLEPGGTLAGFAATASARRT